MSSKKTPKTKASPRSKSKPATPSKNGDANWKRLPKGATPAQIYDAAQGAAAEQEERPPEPKEESQPPANPKPKAKPGRKPTPPEIREAIIEHVLHEVAMTEKGIRHICADDGRINVQTFYEWIEADPALGERYARAQAKRMEVMAERILEIADDSSGDTFVDAKGKEHTDYENIQRSKLRVDTRKWLMSKLAPKKYGDRAELEVSSKTTQGAIQAPDELLAEVRGRLPGLMQALRPSEPSE